MEQEFKQKYLLLQKSFEDAQLKWAYERQCLCEENESLRQQLQLATSKTLKRETVNNEVDVSDVLMSYSDSKGPQSPAISDSDSIESSSTFFTKENCYQEELAKEFENNILDFKFDMSCSVQDDTLGGQNHRSGTIYSVLFTTLSNILGAEQTSPTNCDSGYCNSPEESHCVLPRAHVKNLLKLLKTCLVNNEKRERTTLQSQMKLKEIVLILQNYQHYLYQWKGLVDIWSSIGTKMKYSEPNKELLKIIGENFRDMENIMSKTKEHEFDVESRELMDSFSHFGLKCVQVHQFMLAFSTNITRSIKEKGESNNQVLNFQSKMNEELLHISSSFLGHIRTLKEMRSWPLPSNVDDRVLGMMMSKDITRRFRFLEQIAYFWSKLDFNMLVKQQMNSTKKEATSPSNVPTGVVPKKSNLLLAAKPFRTIERDSNVKDPSSEEWLNELNKSTLDTRSEGPPMFYHRTHERRPIHEALGLKAKIELPTDSKGMLSLARPVKSPRNSPPALTIKTNPIPEFYPVTNSTGEEDQMTMTSQKYRTKRCFNTFKRGGASPNEKVKTGATSPSTEHYCPSPLSASEK